MYKIDATGYTYESQQQYLHQARNKYSGFYPKLVTYCVALQYNATTVVTPSVTPQLSPYRYLFSENYAFLREMVEAMIVVFCMGIFIGFMKTIGKRFMCTFLSKFYLFFFFTFIANYACLYS